jgi:hypothetical protein
LPALMAVGCMLAYFSIAVLKLCIGGAVSPFLERIGPHENHQGTLFHLGHQPV